MSNEQGVKPGRTLKVGEAMLQGRIAVRSRPIATQDGRVFLTVVSLPAPDQYTQPGTVELRSRDNLGAVGDDIQVVVRVGGYRRSFEQHDQMTGEKVKVASANNTLDVVA